MEKDVEIMTNYMLGKCYSQEHIDKTTASLKKYGKIGGSLNIFTTELTIKDQALEDDTHPEDHLKLMLPTFTPIDMDHLEENQKCKDKEKSRRRQERCEKISGSPNPTLDFDEALYFGDSRYAKLISFF